MRVIARSTLNAFVANRIERKDQALVLQQVNTWYMQAMHAKWKNSAELKAQFGSASIISAHRVVFNIKGNDLRLVVSINYAFPTVRILWVGTHKVYDRIDVKTIAFERSRYGLVSDSQ